MDWLRLRLVSQSVLLCYSVGVLFFAYDYKRFNHAIWHLFVLAGSICHFFAVLISTLPKA